TFNPRLRLLNSSGTQLLLDDNSGGDGRNAKIDYTFTSTGTYYVEVTSSTVISSLGDYVLDVNGATLSYPAFAVSAITPASGASLGAAPTQATVTFNGAVVLSSLQAS